MSLRAVTACSTILVLSERLSAGQQPGNCTLGFLDEMSQGPQAVQAPIKVEFQNQKNVGGELERKEGKNEQVIKYMEHIHRLNTTCVYTCKHVHVNIYACIHAYKPIHTHIAGIYLPLLFSSICDFSNNKLPSGTATRDPL